MVLVYRHDGAENLPPNALFRAFAGLDEHANESGNNVKFLVVAAWEPELTRFRERLDAARSATGAPLPPDLDVVLDTLGVGLVEAAIAMTRCVELHRPSVALLLGTCGAFALGERAGNTELRAGDVACGASVGLADASLADGSAGLPAPMPARSAFDAGLADALVAAGAKRVHIANTVGITTDDALAARLARSSTQGSPYDVEHLEAFAFARACAVAGLPCVAVLGVANAVGATGRHEWLANHVRASASAADVAFDALGAIAETLRLRTSTTAPSPARA